MITNHKPSDVGQLNVNVEPEKWEYRQFKIFDENTLLEVIPWKILRINRRYEVVVYSPNAKGVELLGVTVEIVLLARPKTKEGMCQTKGMRIELSRST